MSAARRGEPDQPLIEELTPAPDLWDVCCRLAHLPRLLFLDSANPASGLGRFSFVAGDPFAWLESRRGHVTWSCAGNSRTERGDPFTFLQRRLADYPVAAKPGLPPFQGGAAGLFGYDLCHHIERLPRPSIDEFAVPDMALGFYDTVVAFDHGLNRAWLIATGWPELTTKHRQARALRRLEQMRRLLGRRETHSSVAPQADQRCVVPRAMYAVDDLAGVVSNFERSRYLAAVQRAIDYVHAGDCFQVNLSQRLLHRATIAPLELYDRLRRRNPAPFGAYFDLGEFVLASASPERFLCVHDGEIQTRPIKGTRPRGATPEEDERQRQALLLSAKDRAENVMIVDLLRNDLGRVCAYGSVHVAALCRLETYPTVHHLVSEVRARLRPGLGPVDLLRAAFPGGSVTGAPKIRAMEIIAELEPTARGPYCGSLGYLGFDGSMDTSILIRTFTIGKGWMQFPVGGGIVADSTPEGEYLETLHKAEGMLRALRD
jgi:para-aminobenzoate synthetase component 1